MPLRADLSAISGEIIGGAIEVHRALGPGLLESAYQHCLELELHHRGLSFDSQVLVPVVYRQVEMACSYRIDLIVERAVIVEIKSVEHLLPIHSAQTLTYLRLAKAKQALLMNFNVPILRSGLKSFVK